MIKGDIFFNLSVRSVRLNFLRSMLAAIGIVIGVVAISSMGMLGTNMQLEVKDQLSATANTIVISSDTVRMGPPGFTPSSSSSSGVTKTELTKITSAVGSNGTVIPIYSTSGEFTINSVTGRGMIYGIDPGDIAKFLTLNQTYGNGTTEIGTTKFWSGQHSQKSSTSKWGPASGSDRSHPRPGPSCALPGSSIHGGPLPMAFRPITGSW